MTLDIYYLKIGGFKKVGEIEEDRIQSDLKSICNDVAREEDIVARRMIEDIHATAYLTAAIHIFQLTERGERPNTTITIVNGRGGNEGMDAELERWV